MVNFEQNTAVKSFGDIFVKPVKLDWYFYV